MLITKTSILTGVTRSIDMPVTEEQLAAYQAGTPIQHAMPNLTASEREFIHTGITDKEWDEYLGDEDED